MERRTEVFPLNVEAALAEIELVIAHAEKAKALLLESGTGVVVVPAGGNLQAALDNGGSILFEGIHEGTYIGRKPGTRLAGAAGSGIHGLSDAAFIVPPRAYDIELSAFSATTDHDQAVIRLGNNDSTQDGAEDEPSGLNLRWIKIPTHRGKRGIEVNARNVLIEDVDIRDVWDGSAARRDSQALCIINSSGSVVVRRGHLEAGSEVIIIGGDEVDMAGVVPSDLLFEDLELVRPLSWKDDGVYRKVKNIFEAKTGRGVTLRRSKLSGNWAGFGQIGYAILLTPTRDGQVTNVLIEDCEIDNTGGGLQILGRAYRYHTPSRLSLIFQRNIVIADHVRFGGRGWLAECAAEPESLVFKDNRVTLSGTTLLSYQFGTVKEADGSTRQGGPLGLLEMTGNTATCPKYGITLDGYKPDGNVTPYVNGGPNKEGFVSVTTLEVFENTFTGGASSSVMRRNFPENVYQ